MSDGAPKPRSSGKLVRRVRTHPPVVLDCSGWPRTPGERSSGKLVRKARALPPVEVGPLLPPAPAADVYLELTLALTADADAGGVFAKVVKLIGSLHEYERADGGAGVTWDGSRSSAGPGAVTLVLVPLNPAGAETRLSRLAELMAAAVRDLAGVGGLRGRVVRASDPNRPVFEVAA